MADKERNQNPTVGDTLKLRLIAFNSNLQVDVESIEKIEVYKLDPTLCSSTNKDGRILVATIDGADVEAESTGSYSYSLELPGPTYTIGRYVDVWYVVPRDGDVPTQVENRFEVFSDLWYFSTIPAVYGFDFQFQPNMIRQGSKKWLTIKITPNIPRATDLERYYTNLAISSNLLINIESNCVPCPPQETDLRMVVEDELVTIRDKVFGFYFLDLSEDGLDLPCGIYNVWFKLAYAESLEISPKMQFQVY